MKLLPTVWHALNALVKGMVLLTITIVSKIPDKYDSIESFSARSFRSSNSAMRIRSLACRTCGH